MRILLVSLNFAPEPTGIGKYSGEMAKALVERGHEVRVVCSPPYYPQWRIDPGHAPWRYSREQPMPGLDVWRCPLWVPRRPSGPARLLHHASFALSAGPALLAAVAWRPQLVMAVAPSLAAAPAAWATARLSGARAWLHVQDFELDAAFALGLLRGGWLRRTVAGVERVLLSAFDRVTTISGRMAERLASKGVPPGRTGLLPNWVDTAAVHPLAAPSPMREALGFSADHVVCLYSGTMNRKQALHVIVEAARKLVTRPEIQFVMCGGGDTGAELKAAARDLPNLRFLDLQPAERFNDLLNAADIHLLPQSSRAADLVMPSKLSGMLASGRPVVAATKPGTEVAKVVQGRGVIVPPEDAQAMAAAVTLLADDPSWRRQLGSAARAYSTKAIDATVVLDRLDAEVRALTGTTAGTSAGLPSRGMPSWTGEREPSEALPRGSGSIHRHQDAPRSAVMAKVAGELSAGP